MKSSNFFRWIWGLLIFICTAPQAMAEEVIKEEVRADFFCAQIDEIDCSDGISSQDLGEKENRAAISFNDSATLPAAEIIEESEPGVESGEEEQREKKRPLSFQKFFSKCRIVESLSLEKMSKGVARHPATQDALQERTAAVRFLRICALIC